MSMSVLLGGTFIQAELDYRRERAMQQYHRRPRRQRRRHARRPLGWGSWGQPHNTRPAVS